MFDPMIEPTASGLSSAAMDCDTTASSGALVPVATHGEDRAVAERDRLVLGGA